MDNYDRWVEHDAEQSAWETKLPICDSCGERIQDDYLYDIDGELYCEECIIEHFRKPTEKYMED